MVQRKEKQRRNTHKAQTADLNQQQDHRLAESTPMAEGIHQSQARDAGAGRGRKQRRQKRRRFPASGRHRQGQKPAAHQDNHQKYQHDDLHGGKMGKIPLQAQQQLS